MDRHWAIERNHIRRIVALLFALALLAERAAARPLAVRMSVHALLLNAQFAALTLFLAPAEIAAACEASLQAEPRNGRAAEPRDLIRTAAGLRALAILLAAGCAAPSQRPQRVFPRVVVRLPVLQPGSGPIRLNDTS